MRPADGGLVAAAGLLAGAVNAAAGGGTLIAFPALLATGMPALTANITSSVGLVTGYAGGALGYRRELAGQAARLRPLGVPALLGGLTGAVLLLATPAGAFRAVVGYLVLVACGLLGAQPWLAQLVAGRRARLLAAPAAPAAPTAPTAPTAPIMLTNNGVAIAAVTWPTRGGVFLAGVYGSYFGAGLGVLLLGILGILLPDNIQRTNAAKTLLSFGIN
ncbi:sulfite exporter TauE/SafE family protein, partial [Frankia sp. CiP3]|uniref:sulfite exporter TauE/SafE family protein n=1 Tax=Frankia sp. CiP3 TaxID=2880971 RepID=UPI001EF405AA